ncbi:MULTISPECIES: glycosyltransferase family 2 protein [Methanobacterium]|uniref:Glycosyltransferase family 2 protein n=1 Tax=Methanobacterium veterum TaxID=408577 RepID=A0A9E5DLL6_9EURY|nr:MULTISPECIES: glycosyltransferase family 2 protein [Methanobacterium]MCZ3367498.1 glycosyltransferase family 2 protein [Methanobacterium veterum]MCZ3373354.1 glycosyltransferase family 2 protein [Methanobacterium veterum]
MLDNKTLNITIIILNWNGWKDTVECLESLYQIDYPHYNVIIVDNNSSNDSIKQIKEYCEGKSKLKSDFFEYNPTNKPLHILEITKTKSETVKIIDEFSNLPSNRKLILIKNDKNYGFAEGNNIGIKYALDNLNQRYILLLNNDTVVDQYFLNELIKAGDSCDNIGILGPTVYCYNDKTKIQSAGVKLYPKLGYQKFLGLNEIDNGQFKEITSVDYVQGCALLAKCEIFNEIGLLDTDYFLYWEETDWCFRAKNAGYHVVHVPNAKIWHKGSASSTNNDIIYYGTRNMFWFMKKNARKTHYIIFLVQFFSLRLWLQIGMYLIYYKTGLKGIYSFFNGIMNGLDT